MILVWSNFTISDFESTGVLGARARTPALTTQLEILQPGAAVFFVGEYKPQLMRLFPGLEFQELHSGCANILVARHAPPPLPAKTVWAWHPRLWRKETWDQLPALAEWIAAA